MLRNLSDLEGYAIVASDGIVGHVKDFLFDDEAWVIRYLVVETDAQNSSQRVLISPYAIGQPKWSEKVFPVSITKEQVKNSPGVDTDQPVSRQHEIRHLEYYRYPRYWGGAGLWGEGAHPKIMSAGLDSVSGDQYGDEHTRPLRVDVKAGQGDPHLRSYQAVMPYSIHATDGDIGHAKSLLVEDETWAVRYLVVATSNWWLGHHVLVAPQWIQEVRWLDAKILVNLTRQAVKDAPPYDSWSPPVRSEEARIYQHYGRQSYWADEVRLQNPQYHVIATGPH
jgi:sporulation protein YlmC with PRC-barrel domain